MSNKSAGFVPGGITSRCLSGGSKEERRRRVLRRTTQRALSRVSPLRPLRPRVRDRVRPTAFFNSLLRGLKMDLQDSAIGTSVFGATVRPHQWRHRPVLPIGSGGFTIMEIMLVLGLLGLLLGIVVPRLGFFEDASFASRKLIGMVHTLRATAPLSRQTWRLYLDLDQGQYWAMVVTPNGEQVPRDARFQDGDIETLPRRITLPKGVRFERAMTATHGRRESGQVYVQVFPSGLPEPAQITVMDTDKSLLALHVSPLTGNIRVSDTEIEVPPMPPMPEHIRPLLFPETYGNSISL